MTLDTFESTLLASLREHVEQRAPRAHRRRRFVVAAVGVAAATAACVVWVPGLGTTPAYSVIGNADHVRVTVNRMEDAEGLEAALREKGIDAVVHYEPDGGQCERPGTTPVADRPGIDLAIGTDMFRIDLNPGTVRDGETLVIDGSMVEFPDEPWRDGQRITGKFRSWVDARVVTGPVTPCVPVAPSGGGE
jgi:hypothetical protein